MEIEKRKRICVLLWAYAYELMDDPMVSDDKFDKTCYEINPTATTDRPDLDLWFQNEFDPSTGQWIYKFPELLNIAALYQRLKNREEKYNDTTTSNKSTSP